MTSRQRIWTGGGLGMVGLGAAAAAWWVFSVDTSVDAVPAPVDADPVALEPLFPERGPWALDEEAPVRKRRRRARGEGRGSKVGKAKAKAGSREEAPERRERERVLEPEEMMWARTEFREQRLTDMNDRLDAFAATMEWDEDTTEDVRSVMTETIDEITNQLLRVDAGELEWAEMRRDMRAYRAEQADAVAEILGPDAFLGFAEEMGFDRFAGDAPIDGRVRKRRRGRRAAQR